MSHLVAPIGFRLGKTFLWSKSNVQTSDSLRKTINPKINLSKGIESITKSILLKKGYYPIHFNLRIEPVTGTHKAKVLYYPILKVPSRERVIPTYFIRRPFIRFVRKYGNTFTRLLRRL